MAERWLTTGEVARMFRVDPKTVTRWADAGRLPCTRRGDRTRRYYRESDVRALLAGGT